MQGKNRRMGERAFAVLEDRQGRYCYCSQWAGANGRLEQLLREGPAALLGAGWQRCTDAGARPEPPDPLEYAALYLVSPTGARAYQPVWLGFDATTPCAGPAEGLFVRVESVTERRQLRRYVAGLKEPFHAAIDPGRLTSAIARELLRGALVSYCPQGRLWRWPPTWSG